MSEFHVRAPRQADEAKPGSFRYLCIRYFESGTYRALDGSTRNWQRRALDEIAGEHGAKPVAMMQPRHVRGLRDAKAATPAAANQLLKALRRLFSWANEAEERERQAAAAEQLRQKQQAEEQARRAADDRRGSDERVARVDPPAPSVVRPSAPATAAARPSGDEERIRQLLADYVNAFEQMNVTAIVAIHPSASQQQLETAFKQLRSYRMQIVSPVITMAGNTASVTGGLVTDIQPRVGKAIRESRALTLRLEKRGTAWVIVERR